MTSDRKRCESVRRDGAPCRAPAPPGRTHCFAHDSSLADRRAEAIRKGGRNSSRAARLRSLAPPALLPVFELLAVALDEVHGGQIPPTVGQAMASIARVMVTVIQAGEVEERLRRLEEQLARMPS